MQTILTKRVAQLPPSATIAVAEKARALKKAGHDIISLSVGEPDFDTPDFIKEAAQQAIDAGFTKYTPVSGYVSLREAIAEKLKRDQNLSYTTDEIIVSTGAKQSIFNTLLVLIEKGDTVLIPAPYWTSYPDMVSFCEGTPQRMPTTMATQFKITPEQLERSITPQTKLLILNSPNNPTGAVYRTDELKAIGAVLESHPHVWVMTDDIYEYIQWQKEDKEGLLPHLLVACPALQSRTIVINGVSKAYAMTGWRMGYAAGPKEVIKAMHTVQSQSTTGTCSITQMAAEAALRGDQASVNRMRDTFKQRHDILFQALSNHQPHITCLKGDGAFYLFPYVEVLEKRCGFQNDQALAADLLERTGIACVPGSAFGSPHHLRLSYALHETHLRRAIDRLSQYIHAKTP